MRKVYRTPQEQQQLKAEYNKSYRDANREHLLAYDRARHNTDEHRTKRRERNRPKIEVRRAQKLLEKQNMPPTPPITEKLCPSCNTSIPKPTNEFGKDKSRKDGYAPYCKECTQEKAHARLHKRREYDHKRPLEEKRTRHEVIRKWCREHPLAMREYQMKRNARHKEAVRDDVDYMCILERDGMWCYICTQTILPHHTLEFDHQIPLLPRLGEPQGTHSEDNIHPTHKECNARKSNRRFEDLTDFDKRGPTQTNR